MHKKIIGLTIALLLVCAVSSFAQAAVELTLDEAVSLALRDNLDLKMQEQDLVKFKAFISEARSALLPTLTVSGSAAQTRGYFSKDLVSYSVQTGAKQLLYAGGKVISAVKAGEYGYRASEAGLDAAKLALVANIKTSYYTLVLAEELLELNKAIMDNTKDHFASVKARYEAGLASESDLLSVESGLSSVWQAYDASQNQRQAAEAILGNLLNLSAETRIEPSEGFSYEEKELVYDEAFLEALRKRPEIRQYEAAIEAGRSAVEVAKSGNKPTVYAAWDYYSRSHSATSTSRGWNDYNVLGITVSWPVFDGWLTRAKVEQAIVDLKQAQLAKDKVLQSVALDVKTAYLGLKDAISRLRSVRDQVRLSEDTVRAMKEKFASGIASTLDRDDAELAYSVARFSQNQALYDYMVARAGFARATGGTP